MGLEDIIPLLVWMKSRGPRRFMSVAKKATAKQSGPSGQGESFYTLPSPCYGLPCWKSKSKVPGFS